MGIFLEASCLAPPATTTFSPARLAPLVRALLREPHLSLTGCLGRLGISSDDPFFDDHLDALVSALEVWGVARRGWVYLTRIDGIESVFKVGMTRQAPETRMRSLSSSGVPGDFVLVQAWPAWDAFGIEKIAHEELADCRWKKEFFRGEADDLEGRITSVVARVQANIERVGLAMNPRGAGER